MGIRITMMPLAAMRSSFWLHGPKGRVDYTLKGGLYTTCKDALECKTSHSGDQESYYGFMDSFRRGAELRASEVLSGNCFIT